MGLPCGGQDAHIDIDIGMDMCKRANLDISINIGVDAEDGGRGNTGQAGNSGDEVHLE
jgi:hypothetical protein